MLQTEDKLQFTNTQARSLLYKLYLRLLKVKRSSHEMLHFFRQGNFKKNNRQFDSVFTDSNLKKVEKVPTAYKHMMYALFLQDALPHVKLQEFKVPHTDAVAVIDYQTSRAWLTAINFCRIFNQMRRQNLYALEHMKGLTLNTDDL